MYEPIKEPGIFCRNKWWNVSTWSIKSRLFLKDMALKRPYHQCNPNGFRPIKQIAKGSIGGGLDKNRPLQFHAIHSRGKNDTRKDRKCQICNLQGPKFWGQSKNKTLTEKLSLFWKMMNDLCFQSTCMFFLIRWRGFGASALFQACIQNNSRLNGLKTRLRRLGEVTFSSLLCGATSQALMD